MDYYQLIANSFQKTIETVTSSVDALAVPIEQSSTSMTEALLGGVKVVAVGQGTDAAMAKLLTDILLCNVAYERPPLPALALAVGGSLENATRQLHALTQHTDVVVVFAVTPSDQVSIQSLLDAANDGNIPTVLVSNQKMETQALNDSGTIVIELGELQHLRAIELATMVICALVTLIEHNLFGNFTETNE